MLSTDGREQVNDFPRGGGYKANFLRSVIFTFSITKHDLPIEYHALTWIIAGLMLTGPLRTNCNAIIIEIQTY